MSAWPRLLDDPGQATVAAPKREVDPLEMFDLDGALTPKAMSAITAVFCATGLFTLLCLCLRIFHYRYSAG